VFVFLVAGLAALPLDPLVRAVERVLLGRFRIPPGLAVAGVYLGFAAAVAFAIVGLATVVADQTRQASDRVEAYLTVEHGRSGQTDAARDSDRHGLAAQPEYASHVSSFPVTRLRRLRRTPALRSLVRETRLSLETFVMPLFVAPEAAPNEALPGMSRHTVEGLVHETEELVRLGVGAVILFGIPEAKDDEGSGAWEEDGIVQRALRALRPRFPELLLLTDVCLCEYTSHGHCGVLHGDEVANDETLELLARTAASHVEAGADAVCPSDMMDGRVAAIREALPETPIVAYSAKYASAFYGPFREAAGSAPLFGDRRGYQMDPANVREALRECELDLAEGADVLMVKPALPYLDVIRAVRERFDAPLAAYNVSGESAMVKAAAGQGWLDERQAAIEGLTAIRRAGADFVISYWTKELAGWL
jgi:porphobilinogen synthase